MELPKVLRFASQRELSADECESAHIKAFLSKIPTGDGKSLLQAYHPDRVLCARGLKLKTRGHYSYVQPNSASVCVGDSGGAFVCPTGASGTLEIHGIVSYNADGCEDPNFYAATANINQLIFTNESRTSRLLRELSKYIRFEKMYIAN